VHHAAASARQEFEMTPQATVPALHDEAARTISTLVTAFAADPFIRWMFPKADQYLLAFPRVLQFFAGAAFDSRTAYRSPDFSGAALWLPPGVSPDEEGLGQVLVDHVDAAMQEQVFAVMEQVGGGHPEAPHWYLPAMGVDPIHQGLGLGSTLMDHSLDLCDQTCRRAYLESTNPANIPFYQRHGFEVVGEIQIGGSPVLTRMLREAA
jgi:ribosomal protein S18 acetylase RimI-like enzyme